MRVRMRFAGWLCVLAFTVCASTTFRAVASAQKHAPQTYTVMIQNFAFQPPDMTVNVGDTIVWENKDLVSHTVTAADGSFDSGEIKTGKSWKLVAKKRGAFAYKCMPHPNMHGKLTVK